ncbi:MAG TPA: hypothetical protein VGD00_07680 [Solirubrobacteraceae bacterium]
MAVIVAISTLALAALVVFLVSAPVRRAAAGSRAQTVAERPGADLDAAREAKYREIRDAELDYRTGKLSEQDYRAIDAELRAQALELLDEAERREQRPLPGR